MRKCEKIWYGTAGQTAVDNTIRRMRFALQVTSARRLIYFFITATRTILNVMLQPTLPVLFLLYMFIKYRDINFSCLL